MVGSPSLQYKHPPVQEASFLLSFVPLQEFSLLKAQEHFRKKEFRGSQFLGDIAINTNLEVMGPSGASSKLIQSIQSSISLVFKNRAGNRLILLGDSSLVVTATEPYESKEEMLELLRYACEALQTHEGPVNILRLAVKYINLITVPTQNIRLEDYFDYGTQFSPALPEALGFWHIVTDHVYQDQDRLRVVFTPTPPEGQELLFRLDLEVFRSESFPLELESLLQKARELKEKETSAFEAIITDKLREIFNK